MLYPGEWSPLLHKLKLNKKNCNGERPNAIIFLIFSPSGKCLAIKSKSAGHLS